MDEIKLLTFQCGTAIYGIPIEHVSGVICSTADGRQPRNIPASLTIQGNALPDFETHSDETKENGKMAVLLHSNEVQLALIVDDVIRITALDSETETSGATLAHFPIWRLNPDFK